MLATAREILRFNGLLATLVGRELKARYRGSVLGFFWSLINPALLLLVYSFVFGYVFRPRAPDTSIEPYAIFLVTGLFPWIWLSTSLLEGSMAFLTNAGLLRKAVFPAALLPIVPVLSNLVHFLFALPVLLAAFLVARGFGYEVGGWTAILLPVVIVLELPLIAGLALGLAALNVHFKDVKDILTNLLTLLFFLTPVLYPLDAVPVRALWWLVRMNPFTPFALAYQQVLFYKVVPDPSLWTQMIVAGALAWMIGSTLYRRLSDTLVEAV